MISKVAANFAAADDKKKSRKSNKGDNDKKPSVGSFELFHSEGLTFQSIGEFKKAVVSFSKALEFRPGDKKTLIVRAKCYLKLGDAEKALTDANDIQDSEPEYVKSLLIKANALHQLAQFEYALVYFHRGKKLRPEIQEFTLGIQRAEEAIINAIGDKAGITLEATGDLSDFNEELEIQKLAKKPETTTCDNEVDEFVLERKVKQMCSTKTCKQLLGELYADKEFLETLLTEAEAANNKSDANKHIRSLTIKELDFLDNRSEFWQQQKPLYSRKNGKNARELTFVKSRESRQSLLGGEKSADLDSWVAEELKAISSAQTEGNFEESLERSNKLIKSIHSAPSTVDPMKTKLYLGRAHDCAGSVNLAMGDSTEALKHYKCEYDIGLKYKIQESESRGLENLGRVYAMIGNFNSALKYYHKRLAKEATEEEKTWLNHEIGKCYLESGKYKKAESFGQKSFALAKEELDDQWQMNALVLIGQSQERRGLDRQALETFQDALKTAPYVDDDSAGDAIKNMIEKIQLRLAECDGESDDGKNADGERESNEDTASDSEGKSSDVDDKDDTYDGDDDDDNEKGEENKLDDDGDGDDDDDNKSEASSRSGAHLESRCSSKSNRSIADDESVCSRKCPQNKDSDEPKAKPKNSKDKNKPEKKSENSKSKKNLKNETNEDSNEEEEAEGKDHKKNDDNDSEKTITYNITMKTGDIFTAGTQSAVHIVLHGKYGKTKKILLNSSTNNPTPFEQGKTDKFVITGAEVGALRQVRVFHDGKQMGDGWFLEEMRITSPTFEEVYSFYVHRWFSRYNEDGKTERTLEPTSVSLKPPAEYAITLISGGDSQFSSHANAFIVIFGKYLRTDKLPLKLNCNDSYSVEDSYVDKVKVLGTDVGKITKIRVGHDNLKSSSSWLLEEVKIRSSRSNATYRFEVNQWFDKHKGDGLTERDLKPLPSRKKADSKPPAQRFVATTKKRKDSSSESDKENSGCDDDRDDRDADDDDASSKKKCRNKKNDTNNSQKVQNKKHDEKEVGKNKEKKVDNDAPVAFEVEVKTGNELGSGTDANVYIVLFNEEGKSAKFPLKKSGSKNPFESGRVDIFTLESSLIDRIAKIKIGHDGAKMNSKWLLERVKITSPTDVYLFNVNKWIEGKVDRTLKPDEILSREKEKKKPKKDNGEIKADKTKVKKAKKDKKTHDKDDKRSGDDDDDEGRPEEDREGGDGKTGVEASGKEASNGDRSQYNISVKTGDCFGAGTDANVFIVIEGDKRDTEKIFLDKNLSTKKEQLFERSLMNEFKVTTEDVGKVKGVLIGHDGAKLGAGWFLDSLKVESTTTGEIYHFQVTRWFDKKEDDGKIERHLLPSTVEGNESDAKLHDKHSVKDNNTARDKESATKDKDNTAHNKESAPKAKESTSKKEKESNSKKQKDPKKATYTISVKTGDKLGAGTDADVYIVLVGKNKKTVKLPLKKLEKEAGTFERNATDEFQLEADNVGKISKIIIGHNSTKIGAGWFLDRVRVRSSTTDEAYVFEVDKWLDKKEDDGKIERELEPTTVEKEEATSRETS